MVTSRPGTARALPTLLLASLLSLAAAWPVRGQVVADDFHACALAPVWTFVDPAGDGASVRIDGGYSADAHLALTVPGGQAHEAWLTTLGAPRVEQPLADVDFTAAAKFTSVLPVNYAQQGLLVRQDDSHWLRLELYRDPVGLFHVAAVGGPSTVFHDLEIYPGVAAPLFLRVHRAGQVWTLSWSHDGTTWQVAGSPFTYAMQPVAIGLYAGNRGANPPPHTVEVDWFGLDGAGDDVARNTLTTTVDGGGQVQRTPDLANYACGQPVTLTAVEPLGWAFSGWSGDVNGAVNPVVLPLNGPATVAATFTAVPVDTLLTTIVGGGELTLSPPGGVYNRGTVVTVTAVDAPGWAFAGFAGDLAGTVSPQTVTVDGNRAVTATFVAVPRYGVITDVQPAGAGTVTLAPAGGAYNQGARVAVSAAATPGWAFAGWSGDLTGSSNPDTVVVEGERLVVAEFSPLPLRTLTVTVAGDGSVQSLPDLAAYPSGTAVQLTAVADPGWRFASWSGDLAGTANPATIVLDADRAVQATFEEIPTVFQADDFDRCALGGPWTFVDPYLDGGTAALTGAYSGEASLAISVPAGSEHEIWNGFVGAPHVLQPAQDVDFTAEAKFVADLPVNFAQEGIVVRESEQRWVRAEFFRDETGRMRVAVDRGPNLMTHDVYLPVGTVPPLWMRVTRTGDTWVQSWSTDGTTWTVAGDPFDYDMTVSAIGLFAGNRGYAPPAHTVLVDYFNNTAGAPAAEDTARAPLTVTLDGAGQVTRALGLASYGCGQVETLTAVDQPGWRFVSWSGAASGSRNPVQVTLAGPAEVTAHFEPVAQRTLAVTVAAGNGAVQSNPPGGVHNDGTRVILTAVPAAGWQFTGWNGDLAGPANPDTLVMDADRAVSASFEEIVFAFASDDFHACSLDPVWTFVDGSGDGATSYLSGSYTADARLNLVVPGGSSHRMVAGAITAPYVVQPALDVDFTAETRFDSTLPGVAGGQEGIIVRQDDTLWLRFAFASDGPSMRVVAALPDGVTVPVDAAIGAIGPCSLRVSRLGDTWHVQWSRDGVAWTTPPGSGFAFALDVSGVGLYAGNDGDNPVHTVAADYFKLAAGPWLDEDSARAALTVNVDGGGTVGVQPVRDTYDCGETVTLTPVAARGWTFAGWSGGLTGVQAPAALSMSGPATVTAQFAPLPVRTVTLSTNGDGTATVSPPGGPYYDGDHVIFTAADGPGWAFAGWSGDLAGTANPDTLVLTQDVAVTAEFLHVPQHTVTVSVAGGGGTVTMAPPGGVYNHGHTVQLIAHGDSGHGLVGWSGDLSGAANPATLVVEADHNVVASFAPLAQYELTVLTAGSGSVTASPAESLHYAGTRVVLTAVPDSGWRFSGWSGDLAGVAAVDSLVMDAPRTVTATFEALPPVALADDFSACQLGPQWLLVDPYGDGAAAGIVNAFTDSARVAISVPDGFPHEIWDGIIGAAHILQPAVDRQQFTLEAKFDSRVPGDFGQEGIVVRQDEAHWVRAEFFRDELGLLRVAVDRGPAQITHDVYLPADVHEPLYMRLARDGDQWTQSWSTDGATWTVAGAPFPYTMTVHEVGLFAGNRGYVPPAHTVQVDYFHVGTEAPAAEDSLRNRLDVTIVGNGQVQRALGHLDYACAEAETLTANAAPGWTFSGWTGGLTGSQNPVALVMDGSRTVTATFTMAPVPNLIAVVPPPGACLSQAVSCVGQLPVQLTRTDATPVGAFNLTLELTNLALCAGTASVHEGDYLSALGPTSFDVVANPDGTVTVSGALLGGPCGATAATGVLAWLDVAATIADGTGSVAVTSADLRDCAQISQPVSPAPAATIVVDHTPPPPLQAVTATQVMSGNAPGSLTAIDVAWTPPTAPDTALLEVWRKGFGQHPEYSDGGGAAPEATPAAGDPGAAGWQLAATLPATASTLRDQPPVRDYWYYQVRAVDACGNVGVSAVLPAALDYLLADVAGGVGNGGDDRVDDGDVALLTAAYGSQEGQPAYAAALDVGPTADALPFSLPATDNRVDFEDLMVFSLSHGLDVGPGGGDPQPPSPLPTASNALRLEAGFLPAPGQHCTVDVVMDGDGTVQGLSLTLQWAEAVLQPLSVSAGPLLAEQGGASAVYMPRPGQVDVALLGLRQRGLSGHGVLVSVTFLVLDHGLPSVDFAAVTARSGANVDLTVPTDGLSAAPDLPAALTLTVLHPNVPNPFNPATTVAFDLARPGRVRLQVYGLDGRAVRTLVEADLPTGRHVSVWDGTADDGRPLASGVYLLRLASPDGELSRRVTMLK